MKRIALALVMVFTLSFATRAYADNSTEFVLEDDLTVNGTDGTTADPDADFAGMVKFVAPAKIAIGDAAANAGMMLKAKADGTLEWGTGGALTDSLSDLRLPVWDSTNQKFVDSLFIQSAFGTDKIATLNGDLVIEGDTLLGTGDDLLTINVGAINIDGSTLALDLTGASVINAKAVAAVVDGALGLDVTGATSINAAAVTANASGAVVANLASTLDLNVTGATSINAAAVAMTNSGILDINSTGAVTVDGLDTVAIDAANGLTLNGLTAALSADTGAASVTGANAVNVTATTGDVAVAASAANITLKAKVQSEVWANNILVGTFRAK